MDKNYLKILVCIALATILLVGCTKNEEPDETSGTVITAVSAETIEETDEQPTTETDASEKIDAEALISISFPDEELLAQSQAYTEFIADDTEYQVKVELSTDIAVTNFCVLSLNIDSVTDEGTMIFSENEMYSLETLAPEKPLVVGMVFAGDIPNMGISYVDANGTERVYAIALSGEDGRPLLMKAELTR